MNSDYREIFLYGRVYENAQLNHLNMNYRNFLLLILALSAALLSCSDDLLPQDELGGY